MDEAENPYLNGFNRLREENEKLYEMYESVKRKAVDAEQDASLFRWLEKQKGLDLRSDNMTWNRMDGTKFQSSHSLSANGTQFAPQPTLRGTILMAMGRQ